MLALGAAARCAIPRVRLVEKIQQKANISTVGSHFNRNQKIIETELNDFCVVLLFKPTELLLV